MTAQISWDRGKFKSIGRSHGRAETICTVPVIPRKLPHYFDGTPPPKIVSPLPPKQASLTTLPPATGTEWTASPTPPTAPTWEKRLLRRLALAPARLEAEAEAGRGAGVAAPVAVAAAEGLPTTTGGEEGGRSAAAAAAGWGGDKVTWDLRVRRLRRGMGLG